MVALEKSLPPQLIEAIMAQMQQDIMLAPEDAAGTLATITDEDEIEMLDDLVE